MHEFLLKRNVHQRIFTRLVETINLLLQNESSSTKIIGKRLNELNDRWISLQESHDSYIISCFSDPHDIDEQDRYIDALSNEFYTVESNCEKFIDSKDNTRHSNQKSPENAIKLQRLKFPIFDGHIRNYAKFKHEFDKFVKPMCSNNQLAFVLKSYLCDSVRKDVENFDYDIDLMWCRLDAKYGSKQKLIDSILSEIERLSENNNSPESLLKMIYTVEAANNDLMRIDSTAELNNSTIISMVEQQINLKMQDEWIQIALKIPFSDRFKMLLSFLDNWKICIEYANLIFVCPLKTLPILICPIHKLQISIIRLSNKLPTLMCPTKKLPFIIHACA